MPRYIAIGGLEIDRDALKKQRDWIDGVSVYFTLPPELQGIQNLLDEIQDEIDVLDDARKRRKPMWKCNDCHKFKHEDPDEVIKHLITEHHYPKRDAEISCILTEEKI